MWVEAESRQVAGLTRRSLVKRAALAGATLSAPALIASRHALAGRSPSAKACKPVPTGTHPAALAAAPDGRLLWVADSSSHTITAVGTSDLARRQSIDIKGAPIDIAITPGGALGLVVSAFWHRPGLDLVDLAGARVLARLDVGIEPCAVAVAPDGRRAYVLNSGPDGTLVPVDLTNHSSGRPIAVGPHPRGVAVDPTRALAVVAVNGGGSVKLVDLDGCRVSATIATTEYPYRVALAPDSLTALVTHSGLGAQSVSVLNLGTGRVTGQLVTGPDPCCVAFAGDGRLGVVSDYAGAALTILDLANGGATSVGVGHRPRGVAIAPSGDVAFTVNEFEGTVSSVDLGVQHA
jgi:DNA-binding beta-propeller fold protein YncE